jgi:hypothetical protein
MKQELRPSIVFSTMPVFDLLRRQLYLAGYNVIQFVDGKVSLDRINDFLHNVRVARSLIATPLDLLYRQSC